MEINDKVILGVIRQFDKDSRKGRLRILNGEDDIKFQLRVSYYLEKLVINSFFESEPILLILDSDSEAYDGYKIDYKAGL